MKSTMAVMEIIPSNVLDVFNEDLDIRSIDDKIYLIFSSFGYM